MNASTPVVAELPDYVVAIAGLPLSTERVDRAAGAIVVVDGATRWWDAATLAVEAGAAVVLVAEPREVPLGPVARLAQVAAQSGVTILVHRARLREDLVAVALEQRAGRVPRVVVAECRAAAGDLPAMVRDAIGWTRALAGERLTVAAASFGRASGTALLRSPSSSTRRFSSPPAMRLRRMKSSHADWPYWRREATGLATADERDVGLLMTPSPE